VKRRVKAQSFSLMIEPKTVAHCLQTTRSDNYINTNSGNEPTDRRVITRGKMKAKVEGYEDLGNNQRSRLLKVSTKYQSNLTKRPRKCAGFESHFKIVGKVPKTNSSRTIPFALRDKCALK